MAGPLAGSVEALQVVSKRVSHLGSDPRGALRPVLVRNRALRSVSEDEL